MKYEAQVGFWRGRLAELWVRQLECPRGRVEEKSLGRLTEYYETTIDPLNNPECLVALRKANTRSENGALPPYQRSPWPFPQVRD